MEKRVVEENYELNPDNRKWMYDCEGNKVVKGDFTKLFTKLWHPEIQSDVSEVIVE